MPDRTAGFFRIDPEGNPTTPGERGMKWPERDDQLVYVHSMRQSLSTIHDTIIADRVGARWEEQ